MITFLISIFILSAICYLMGIISDPLDEVGEKLGHLLKLPEEVISSTFQALATSGPEILMAIIAATPFVANKMWNNLELSEKACSGTLNMIFSSMDNLLGIGAVAIIALIILKKVNSNDLIPKNPSTIIGLLYYIFASSCFSIMVRDSIITPIEGWIMMVIGIMFILSQFIVPKMISSKSEDHKEEFKQKIIKLNFIKWFKELSNNIFIYLFLIFGLIILVKSAMSATFNMASLGIFSVAGILLMFTSFVSSFPEFMLAIHYVKTNKKETLLGMLFGSNVIDLAFSGFRSIWLSEPMKVVTSGMYPKLLNLYILALPVSAFVILIALISKKLKYKHSYIMLIFYLLYVISGLFLI